MARKRTGVLGLKARFFRVTYSRAEMEAHNEATRDMIFRGAWCEFFSTAPGGAGRVSVCFAIAEEEAEAYERRLHAARSSSFVQAGRRTA